MSTRAKPVPKLSNTSSHQAMNKSGGAGGRAGGKAAENDWEEF